MYCLFCVVLFTVCFVLFCLLCLCKCVLNYCHLVATQQQLIKYIVSYHNHSNRHWCSENPRNIYEVPLRNLIAGGWYVVSAHRIMCCTILKKMSLPVALN
jgi:hypothetical protein